MDEVGRGEGRFKREGTHACLWLIHVDVWQNPSQYYNYPPIKINLKNIFLYFKEIILIITQSNDLEGAVHFYFS